ncbi:MAG: hypothetical protein V1882_01360 [Candidatus Omnitrophota bacterium]
MNDSKDEIINTALKASSQSEPPTWAIRVVFFVGGGFILTSFYQLMLAADFKYYSYLFQDYPSGVIHFRHFISCSARFMGIVFGIGLLYRKEFFRKASIFLAFATMALVYLKHPYAGVVRHLQYSNELMAANGLPFSPESVIRYFQAWSVSWATESVFAYLLLVFFIVSDICFAICVIFLLTRPSVKSLFK